MTEEEIIQSSSTFTDEDFIAPTPVPKPDRENFDKKVEEMINDIKTLKDKQNRIYTKIDATRKAKEEFQVCTCILFIFRKNKYRYS